MFLQNLINGLTIGSTYALMGLGFTLVFGVLGLLNLAHGEIYMAAAYLAFFLLSKVQLNPLVLIGLISVVIFFLGVGVERCAFRPLREQPPYIPLISTIAVSLIFQEMALLIFGPQAVTFPDVMTTQVSIGSVSVSSVQLVTIGISVTAMVILHLFLRRTRMGRTIRATSEDYTAATLMGVPTDRIISITFGVGAVLAGIAGILIAFYYSVAYPTMGFQATFRAFIISVVGGMGSVPGAVIAGFFLGLIDTFSITILPSGFSDAIPFLVLIAFLLFKPTGIVGKKGEEAGEGQEFALPPEKGKLSLGRLPFSGWFLAGALIVVALLLPFMFSSYYVLRLAFLVALYGILALGLNFVLGYTGQLSMCHASFYAVGAYTTALLSLRFGAPFFVTVPASCLLGFVFGILVGLPGLRLKGYYLALVTLGFGALLKVVLTHWYDVTGGPNGLRGIPQPAIFSYVISSQTQFYYLVLFFLLFTCFVAYVLHQSLYGRSLIAIRDNETAALALGIPATRYKVLAFALSGLFAGLAGSLYAYYASFISPELGDFWESVIILAMVVLGGLGNTVGVLLGAAIFVLLPELFRPIGDVRTLAVGIILLAVILFRPQGLLPMRIIPRLVFKTPGLKAMRRTV